MLVRAFQIHHLVAGLARKFGALVEHAEVGHARIEPDVENVGDLVVVVGFGAEQFARIERVPRIGAFLLDALRDLLHQFDAARMRFTCGFVDE